MDGRGYMILPAGPGDAADLAAVHVRAWRETYPGMLPRAYLQGLSLPIHARRFRARLLRPGPMDVTLCVEGRQGLVGYCEGGPARDGALGEAEVATLYLLQAVKRQGVGRRLLTAAARVLAERGAASLVIWVLSANTPARAFYERLGGALAAEKVGPGPGGVVREVCYRWTDIGVLANRVDG